MCFCFATLRGAAYFMATLHMVGTFLISIISAHLFMNPPNYPDINLSPVIMTQLPLIVASYSMLASFFACFIFRAIDMDSLSQLRWSLAGFSVYQSLTLLLQLIFSLMFGDILSPEGQAAFGSTLLLNFLLTLVYLTVLSLYGMQLWTRKKQCSSQLPNKLYRNSLTPFSQEKENNSGKAKAHNFSSPSHPFSKEVNIPDRNFLRFESRSSSTATLTSSIGTNTEYV